MNKSVNIFEQKYQSLFFFFISTHVKMKRSSRSTLVVCYLACEALSTMAKGGG